MKKYFEIKASFEKVDEESGKQKKVKETYLLDAVSFTEGEARINAELEKIVSGDFSVTNMATSNIAQVFRNNDGDRFFKAKVVYEDEEGKKVTEYMLVEAETVENAYVFLTSALSDMIVPFEIPSISESKILDVFEYDLEEAALTMSQKGLKFSQVNDQMKAGVDIAKSGDMTGFAEYDKARFESEQ